MGAQRLAILRTVFLPLGLAQQSQWGESFVTRSGRLGGALLISLLFSLLLGCTVPVAANSYFVSANGQGNGSSSDTPMSLAEANRVLRAGDTALLLSGRYTTQIAPQHSGQERRPIIYRAAPGEQPQLVGRPDLTRIVDLDGRHHVRIQGLNIRFDPVPTAKKRGIAHRAVVSNVYIGSGQYIDILDNRFINPRSEPVQIDRDHKRFDVREMGVTLGEASRYNTIRGNTMVGMLSQGVFLAGRFNKVQRNHIIRTHGNAVMLNANRDVFESNLIEENVLSGSVLSDGVQSNPDFKVPNLSEDLSADGLVIRRNLITHNGENGIDLKGASRMLVEDNLIVQNYGSHDGPLRENRTGGFGGVGHGARSSTDQIIVRRNVIYDNASGVFLANGWVIYNNVLVNNSRDFQSANSRHLLPSAGLRKPRFVGAGGWARGVVFMNNIVGDHPEVEMIYNSGYGDLVMDGNLYYNTRQAPRFVVDYKTKQDWRAGSFEEWQRYIAMRNENPAIERHSMVGAPKFNQVPDHPVGVKAYDFRIQADSPARDSGRALTQTRAGGAGKTLPVKDARLFFDGFGWLPGDVIQLLGTQQTARVVRQNTEAKTLTLDKALRWEKGQGVTLAYHGSAPDRGACEWGEAFCASDMQNWVKPWAKALATVK